MFGISWEDALKSGKVLNAKEACAKFGVDGNEMENMWGKLDKSKEMIKFVACCIVIGTLTLAT